MKPATEIMVYEKNGATAPYNEAIFKKGGWKILVKAPAAPVGVPVPDDLPHVKSFIEPAAPEAPAQPEAPAPRKPGRPPKNRPAEE